MTERSVRDRIVKLTVFSVDKEALRPTLERSLFNIQEGLDWI